ncbi:repressor of yield of DENV family protein [Halocynthiibacter styelae]|uniref:Uncharacterized protein n=1 Tax=Halocynthiibacter styelae TaxID=2761955 RepID=A0A8J7LLH2_9RHOB|nr:repressor of yield of DENV family protein [Paenihalocynthiibacter styelae]MBI1495380.1 hypothetical protein [Paenihalocynthiibacter styelae]
MTRPSYEPHAEECRNPGRDDYWTCPGCYTDLPGDDGFGIGEFTCPECDRAVVLSVEHDPVSIATLKEGVKE